MYTPTVISNPSPQAQTFSQELLALIRERRAQSSTLGLPDVLVAMEIAKTSLLSESGVTAARSRVLVAVAAALLVGVAAFVLFANQ